MKKLTIEERRKIAREFMDSKTGKDFTAWWKNHRHSGYSTNGREVRWGISPYMAALCDRYMAEYCSDRSLDEKLRFEYSASDYDRWAEEQKAADDAVAKFASEHNGREIPTTEEFAVQLRRSLFLLAKKFAMKKDPGYGSLSEEQIQHQLNAHMRTFKV